MLVIETIDELKDVLFRVKSSGKTVGFVPTMGALHAGHFSLLEMAKKENNVVVCSIFVNPIQFNKKEDLDKYPRNLTNDLYQLQTIADIVFTPTEKEIFPELPTERYDFGELETVLEGKYRAGHFNGVAIIIKRLFDWIVPDKAYFGEKDFQQLVIIRELVRQNEMLVQIVACPTVREPNGLAMSSRNQRLTPEKYEMAANIYRILQSLLTKLDVPIAKLKEYVANEIAKNQSFKLEYFEIVNSKTLQSVNDLNEAEEIICCIAVYVDEVRLIDNLFLKRL